MWFRYRHIQEDLERMNWWMGHMHTLIHEIWRTTMATNEDLNTVRELLTEAATEIPAKIDALVAQVGDAADPALVAEIKDLAAGLADIVPNEAAPADENPA